MWAGCANIVHRLQAFIHSFMPPFTNSELQQGTASDTAHRWIRSAE